MHPLGGSCTLGRGAKVGGSQVNRRGMPHALTDVSSLVGRPSGSPRASVLHKSSGC